MNSKSVGNGLFVYWLLGVFAGIVFMFLDGETKTLFKNIFSGIDYVFFYIFYRWLYPRLFGK